MARKKPRLPLQPGQTAYKRGRPKGTLDKFAIQQAIAVEAHGMTPLQFCMIIMRKDLEGLAQLKIRPQDVTVHLRMRAAENALPYVHRKMPIAIDGGDTRAIFTPAALQAMPEEKLRDLLTTLNQAQRSRDVVDVVPH